ncbi:hypothetical protein V2J09_017165 [Rumex salicifolius]
MASAVFYCGSEEFSHQQISEQDDGFLDACFMCHKPLGFNHDIFMYRGNTAFCSEECRQEQIEIDEKKERRRNRRRVSPAGSAAAGSDARATVAGAVSVA